MSIFSLRDTEIGQYRANRTISAKTRKQTHSPPAIPWRRTPPPRPAHSARNDFTGFITAALTACQLMVTSEIDSAIKPENTNTLYPICVR